MNNLRGFLSFHGNVSGQMGSNLITNVEANPAGTPTEILTSIRVGDIIYSIPSGGGGTNNYNDLLNKPKINNVVLSGELSLTELGIQAKINFPNDNSKYLDGEGNFTTPAYFSGDYDDLTDKPQINSVTLEGNKTASDLKLISEIHTASGAEAAIETDDTLPLLSCVSDINPVQSGSGTPSPSNIRPISGHTDVTVTVASTSGGSGDDTTVSLGRTVYGGTLDVTTGELAITHILKNITSTDISDNGSSGGLIELYINGTTDKKNGQTNMYCNNLEVYASPRAYAIRGRAGSANVTFCLPLSDVPDFNSAQTWVDNNPIQLVYELATPQTYNLTPTQVLTLLGQNYVRCDTGDIQVTYVTDIADPLLKWLLENR